MKKDNRKYYAAYEERYKTAHANGVSWSSDENTPIVMEVIDRYKIRREHKLLEIGCGEGRDSRTVLDHGFPLMATDISEEAIAYCRQQMPRYEKHFSVLNCLSARLEETFDFIFAIAVVHMLVLDEDRDGFYRFIRSHLTAEGKALICTMGDGTAEYRSDPETAFTLQKRIHGGTGREVSVAGTTCRMISFDTFRRELADSRLQTEEMGLTAAEPDFNSLLYAVVGRA